MKLPSSSNLFGVACPLEEASIVIIPVPWEVTVSSRSGTALGPESILKASQELRMIRHEYAGAQAMGVTMLPIPHDWKMLSDTLRHHTIGYIQAHEAGLGKSGFKKSIIKKVDHYAHELKEEVKAKARKQLQAGKMVGVLGGDHSVALGLFEALGEFYNNFGVLQIDAHGGLHKAYQGFKYSHASIMHNVLQLGHVIRLVPIALRNYSAEEAEVIEVEEGRIIPFFDRDLKRRRFEGMTWEETCWEIVEALPERVYVSFDIDGLDAKLCPSTGTPVPGGLEFDEVSYLLEMVVKAGKKIVGFDLCEVAPGENMDWDAQVGSQVLYKLAMMMGASQGGGR
ncbi:MAG: arginase family protein [Bacteroidota bacterium]